MENANLFRESGPENSKPIVCRRTLFAVAFGCGLQSTSSSSLHLVARQMLGWPKRCKLAHAFLWAYSDQRLKMAQPLGQLGVLLTSGETPSTALR